MTHDCRRAGRRISELFGRVGKGRHQDKGCWEGTRQLDYLGMYLDRDAMKVYVLEAKVRKVQGAVEEDYANRAKKLPSGFTRATATPLQRLCHPITRSPAGWLSYASRILRHVSSGAGGPETAPPDPPLR